MIRDMIRNVISQIFLPEKIGNRYVFSKKIVGIEIRKAEIIATKVTVQDISTTLELCLHEQLTQESGATQQERVSAALKALSLKLGSYDELHICLPSSIVVFKELQLPFSDPDKIKMALPFEVEGLLPFPLKETALDFIITHPNTQTNAQTDINQNNQTTILDAAVRTAQMAEHLALFAQSDMVPTVVTVDFFALYGLYTAIPEYAALTGGVVLISLDTSSTRIGYIYNGALKLVRTINHGVSQIAKTASSRSEQSPSDIGDHLLRFGIAGTKNPKQLEDVQAGLLVWWKTIELTLASFASQSNQTAQLSQTNTQYAITKILFLGKGAEITGVSEFIKTQSGLPCELFDASLLSHAGITLPARQSSIPYSSFFSIGTALPVPITSHFNLQADTSNTANQTLFLKQIGVTVALGLMLITALCTNLIIQRYSLSHELAESQQEALQELQDRFKSPADGDEPTDLDEAMSAAKTELRKGQDMWLLFGPERHYGQYLAALSALIDREKLGFIAEKITIKDDTITLKAEVKDYDALKSLESALRSSDQFQYLEPQSEYKNFTMKVKIRALSRRDT